jgi:single-strand DNA-binding protein
MLNKCEFIGRITKDLELKQIKVQSQEELMSKVDFNIAHNFKKNGNKEVMFIPCTAWGKQADNMLKFLNKGSKIYVEGYLNISNYIDEKTNEKKTFTKINVKNVIFLDSKQEEETTNELKTDSVVNIKVDLKTKDQKQQEEIIKPYKEHLEYLKKKIDKLREEEKLINKERDERNKKVIEEIEDDDIF